MEEKTLCINDLKPSNANNELDDSKNEIAAEEVINEGANALNANAPLENQEVVEMKIGDLKPFKEHAEPAQRNINELFSSLDTAVDERIKRDEEFINKSLEEHAEKELEKEINSEDDDKELLDNPLYSDDLLFEDLKDDDEEDDATMEEIKSVIKERIKPVANAVDLSTFTISKKHVSVMSSLKSAPTNKHVADWALVASGKPISISELSGYEIQKLNPSSSGRNRYNTYRDIYKIIYDHVIDQNKPPFDIWLKEINFFDNSHLYFALYRACFEGTNDIPYSCPSCKHVFMEDYPLDDMVKYKTDKDKALVKNILQSTSDSTTDGEYQAELLQISDNFVVSLREPSIWNMIFEHAILDDAFTEKYSNFLAIMVYIDEVYSIDRETSELNPIDIENDPKNIMKHIKSRLVKYSEVFKTLNSDQLQVLQAAIANIDVKHSGVTYVLPQVTCPKCGKIIEEQAMEPDQLLFTRHQLAAIANI